MVIVWRVRGKLSGLFCAILCTTIVPSVMDTHMNRPNSSLDWVFVSLGSFHCAEIHFCVCMYFLYDCILHVCEVL